MSAATRRGVHKSVWHDLNYGRFFTGLKPRIIIYLLSFIFIVSYTFALFPMPALAASISLNPSSGIVTTQITVTGSGFATNTSGIIWFDGNDNGNREFYETPTSVTTTSSGTIPPGTYVSAGISPDGLHNVMADIPAGSGVEASASFTIVPRLASVAPTSGPPGTIMTMAGDGFAASEDGWIWFDSNGDSIMDDEEPQVSVTTNNVGSILSNAYYLMAPEVSADIYQVRADIPAGGDVEAEKSFTVTPGINIDPSSGLMDTVISISVTGGSFPPGEAGVVWFDTDNNNVIDYESEPYVEVEITETGALPGDVTLETPLLEPNTTYRIRADIPTGGAVETFRTFTTGLVTTALVITKYDAYGNVINQVKKTYDWLKDSRTVYGNDETHWYLQGIVETGDPWDPTETINIKDWGTNQGTDLKDLCELVGGMSPGDTVSIIASDPWSKTYDYPNVYTPDPRQGRIAICWWNNGEYVPDFPDGMRMIFLADDNVFGNWDQHECFPESRWYFYQPGLPTTTGHSGKWIYKINIYEPKLVSCNIDGNKKDSFAAGETVYVKGIGLAETTSYKIWIQDEPMIKGDTLNTGDDPSGTQVTVTTDGNGVFSPQAIWSDVDVVGKYDIVADNQAEGTVDTYDTNDDIDDPGWEGFSTTEAIEVISLTVTDYNNNDGINFGSLNPGQTGAADCDDEVGAVTITVGEETNVDVDVQVMGTDFNRSGGGDTIPIGNVEYDNVNVPDEAIPLTGTYFTWYSVPSPTEDHVTQVWYWMTVPPGKLAGDYTSTFLYRAVKQESP